MGFEQSSSPSSLHHTVISELPGAVVRDRYFNVHIPKHNHKQKSKSHREIYHKTPDTRNR